MDNIYPVDPLLNQAVQWQESRDNPDAISDKGAEGLMQTMPTTLTNPGYGVLPAKDNSPQEKKRVGDDYLQAMHNKYGDRDISLMAYNWGPGHVDNWIANGQNPAEVPNETKDYVQKVNKTHQQLQSGAQMASNEVVDPDADLFKNFNPNQGSVSQEASADPDADLFKNFDPNKPTPQSVSDDETQYTGLHGLLQNIGSAETVPNAKAAVTEIGSQWPESMSPTDIAMLAPATLVGGIAGEGTAAIGNALTRFSPEIARNVAGSKILQLAGKGVVGATQGAAFNATTGDDAATGGATGAIANMVIPGAGMATNAIQPELAQLAKTAADKYGIKIPAGLLSGNPLVNRAYSMLDRMGMIPKNDTAQQFTSAVGNEFGANSPTLTNSVMAKAKTDIGSMYNEVADTVGKAGGIPISNDYLDLLQTARENAVEGEGNVDKFFNKLTDNLDASGKINSDTFKKLTQTGSYLDMMQSSTIPEIKNLGITLERGLYDELGKATNGKSAALLKEADQKYAAWHLADASRDDITGQINPAKYSSEAWKKNKDYFQSVNNLNNPSSTYELAQIAERFKPVPSSGTAENNLMLKAGGLALGAAGGAGAYHYDPEDTTNALQTLAGAYVGGKLGGRALSSNLYRNMLLNKSLNASSGVLNGTINSAIGDIISNPRIPAILTGNRLISAPQSSQQ